MSEVQRQSVSTTDRTVPLGELPPLGEIPKTMTALVVRQDRFGDPEQAF